MIGRRIYRVSPSGRRYNTQQTIGLQAENWPTPQTSDAGGIADARAAALSHTPENQERAQLYRRVAAFTNEDSPNWPTPRTKQGHTFRQHARDGRQGLTLEGRAERWPTPRERDSYERRNWKTVEAANRGEVDLTLPSKAIPLNARDMTVGMTQAAVAKVESGAVARGPVALTWDDVNAVWRSWR